MLGKTRAKQYYQDDTDRHKSLPILLHGDGAFSGQGIVFETLDMSQLVDYTVGGTIHLVVNNQVGGCVRERGEAVWEGEVCERECVRGKGVRWCECMRESV